MINLIVLKIAEWRTRRKLRKTMAAIENDRWLLKAMARFRIALQHTIVANDLLAHTLKSALEKNQEALDIQLRNV